LLSLAFRNLPSVLDREPSPSIENRGPATLTGSLLFARSHSAGQLRIDGFDLLSYSPRFSGSMAPAQTAD
jgi:hypothetical protein